MKKQLRFVVFIGMFSLILSFTNSDFVNAAKLPKGSNIGNISVEQMDEDEVKEKLLSEIELWQTGEDIVLKSDFEKFYIPRTAFKFDIDATLNEFHNRTKRQLDTLFLKKKNVHIPFDLHINESDESVRQIASKNYIDFNKTMANVIDLAKTLDDNTASIIYDEDREMELDQIVQEKIDIPNDLSHVVVTYAINELDGQIIAPDDAFSFLQTVELPEKMTRSTEELSFVASALHEVMLKANFDIIFRKPHLYKPSYIADGLDVHVNPQEENDFITHNKHEFSIKINAKRVKDKLELTLSSHPLDLTYDYEVKDKQEINPRTIYRFSKKVAPGQREIVSEGEKGFTANLIRHSYNNRDVLIDSEFISEEFALPMPEIVLLSIHDEEAGESNVTEEEQLEESIRESIRESLGDDFFDYDLDDIDDEINRIEEEVEEIIEQSLNEFNKQAMAEFEDYMKKFMEFIDLIETENEKELNEKLEEIEEQMKEQENNPDGNEDGQLFYQFLIDFLLKSKE